MAQAVEQHTPIEIRSLDDYVADLIATLGCERYPALWEMWERIATKRLLFIRQRLVDGKPYSPWDHPTVHGTPKPYFPEVVDVDDFRSNYKFEFDDHDRVKVFSPEWSVYRYTVAELPHPPASQTGRDQQQRRPTKASKPDSGAKPSRKPSSASAARDAAIKRRLLDNGDRPPSNVTWPRFCQAVRVEGDGFIGDRKDEKYKRGFSDDTIEDVTRELMKSLAL
jgi:hypothetical protein